MKHKLLIQFFGGRGQYLLPRGSSRMKLASNSAVFVQFPSLKEALGKKGKPMEQNESAEGANPFHSDKLEPYAINCQRCVVAYELRRRGYDVIAQPNPGDKWAKIVVGKDNKKYALWKGAFRHAKTDNVLGKNAAATVDNIVKKMKEYGNGSRAVVEFIRSGGGGHVVNVENKNGKVVFVEAQTKLSSYSGNGRTYSRSGIEAQMSSKPKHVALTRTDNLQVSHRAKEFVDQKSHISGRKR